MLEKTLESPLDCKEIQLVHPKGNQSWVLIGRTDFEAETPILRPPHAKSWLIWKDPDAGKDWGQEEKGMTEDEMVGWHHRLNGHGFGWTPGVGDGQGGLACCGSWGCKESDMTEHLHFHFSLFTFMHWIRKWQPTPVFLPGESQGWASLVGCCLWGRTESDNDWSTLAAAAAANFISSYWGIPWEHCCRYMHISSKLYIKAYLSCQVSPNQT